MVVFSLFRDSLGVGALSRRSKLLFLLLFAFFSLYGEAFAVNYDLMIREKESILRRMEKQLKYQQYLILKYKHEERDILKQMEIVDRKINRQSVLISLTVLRIKKVKAQMSDLRKELAKLDKDLKAVKGMLAVRIRDMYMYGKVGYLEIVLGAKDFGDLVTRFKFIKLLAKEDVELANRIMKIRAEKEKVLSKLAVKVEELNKLKVSLLSQKRTLVRQRAYKEKLLNEVRHKKAFYKRAYKVYKNSIVQLRNVIRELYRKKEEQMRMKKSPYHIVPTYTRGKLQWPVIGPVTSGYGMRVHPIFHTYTFHSGIDISVPVGTPVRAPADGVAMYVGWIAGFGKVLILDHGGGLSTVYAHLSSVVVKVGQRVKTGQIIAYTGTSGLSTGPHLHFEVRVNGKPVNPLRWLKRR